MPLHLQNNTTLILLLGASKFPRSSNLPSAEAFARSHAKLKQYFLDRTAFDLKNESNLLDLFDKDAGPDALDEEISSWLQSRIKDSKMAGVEITDLITYYTGHGGFKSDSQDYYLATRATNQRNPYFSSLPIQMLAATFRESARYIRKHLIIDACFSGVAAKNFMAPLNEVIRQKIDSLRWDEESSPKCGTALLCSSSSHDPSKYLDDGLTMFSGALCAALHEGNSLSSEFLSLDILQELTWQHIQRTHGDNAIKPEIHDPDQRRGLVSRYPLFPNRANLIALPNVTRSSSIATGISADSFHTKLTSDVLGIDFGTSSSLIAVLSDGKPVVIPNRFGNKSTPSVVNIADSQNPVVGQPALTLATAYPDATIFSVKRLLGTNWSYQSQDKTWTAEDIAAEILKSLRSDAKAFLGKEVNKVVATVPANSNSKQRTALVSAMEKAGFEVLRVVAEPTAAAVAYGFSSSKEDKAIAVYDLGAGTFDVSILEIGDGVCEVKSVNGDMNLGGDDFDERIAGYLKEEFHRSTGIDLNVDKSASIRLKLEAEKAKIALSVFQSIRIYVPYLGFKDSELHHLDVELTRSQYESLIADLVERTIVCCEDAITRSMLGLLGLDKVDEVLMTGLSAKTPLVFDSVAQLFRCKPRVDIDPDEAVVIGACYQGGVLSGQIRDSLLLDVVARPLGFVDNDGNNHVVIQKNTTIPTKKSIVISPLNEEQGQIILQLVEGDDPEHLIRLGYALIDLKNYHLDIGKELNASLALDADSKMTVAVSTDTVSRFPKEERYLKIVKSIDDLELEASRWKVVERDKE